VQEINVQAAANVIVVMFDAKVCFVVVTWAGIACLASPQ
jgi:hypothetical protein